MLYIQDNKYSIGKVVSRMGLHSFNKLCKCNFHRVQYGMRTRRKLKRRSSSIKAGNILAFAIRAESLGLVTFGIGCFLFLIRLLFCFKLNPYFHSRLVG